MAARKKAAVAKKEEAALVAQEFLDDAHEGFEETTARDVAIPFIKMLQPLSPEATKGHDQYIDGAEAGNMLETVSQDFYEEIDVIPCYFQSRWVEWVPRDAGGGFVRQYDAGAKPPGAGERDIRVVLAEDADGNATLEAIWTQYHYVLIVKPDGDFEPACIAMSSTQLKYGSRWNSRLQSLRIPNTDKRYPRFAHVFKLTPKFESNEKGSWYSWDIALERRLALDVEDDAQLYAAARDFKRAIAEGAVELKHETLQQDESNRAPDNPDEDFVGGDDIL